MYRTLAILAVVLAVALPLILRGRSCGDAKPDTAAGRLWHLLFLISLALMALTSVVVMAVG